MNGSKQERKLRAELVNMVPTRAVASAFIERNAPCKRVDWSRNNTPPALSTGS